MTNQVIPAEAVDAALSISLRQLGISGKPLPDGLLDARRAIVSEILEAAAPYMMAAAWDEGIEAGVDGGVSDCDYARNPYRPTP